MEHEFGLGHCPFKGIHHKDNAVYHFKHPLHLAAKVRMPGGVYDVDLGAFISDGGIFGKNGNTPFPLNIVGIHNPFCHRLVFAEYAALF